MSGPSILKAAVGFAAATAGAVALAVLLPQQRTTPMAAAPPPPAGDPVAAPAPAARPGTWLLRAGGWYIRVDGAEVPVPSLLDQTASRSDKGAVGLMQVRPIAAEAVGAVQFQTPADNVQTGVRYLRQLDDMFHAVHGRDHLAVILAAYNIGPGHIHDAQTLARTFGYDPNRWQDALELMLPLLEQPSIYKWLPNGYAKGSETVAYVDRVLERYDHYRRETLTAVSGGGTGSPSDGPGNG
jgi:membrane-bound lytic murein transglycosylase F